MPSRLSEDALNKSTHETINSIDDPQDKNIQIRVECFLHWNIMTSALTQEFLYVCENLNIIWVSAIDVLDVDFIV